MKFLVHMAQLLYPADTGGKIRSSKLFEKLAQQHDVTIVGLVRPEDTQADLDRMLACCRRFIPVVRPIAPRYTPRFYWELTANLCSRLPYMVQRHTNREAIRTMQELLRNEQFDVLMCDFLQPNLNLIPLSFHPKILFEHNVESMVLKRYYETAHNPAVKAYFRLQWRRLFRAEKRAALHYDHCIEVSEKDCRTMQELYGVTNTSAIPTGVDVDFYRPGDPAAEGNDLVFTASMDWLPNEDGTRFFVEQVLPRIRQEVPGARFWAVGRNPSPALQRFAAEHEGIELTGTVDDVRPFIERAAVYVVPLRVGGGTRMKIFEAMAMNKAVVSTAIGAEGLPVIDGENIVLADAPGEFAGKVVKLLRDRGLRRKLGESGSRMVRENFTWDAVARVFAGICEKAAVKKDDGMKR